MYFKRANKILIFLILKINKIYNKPKIKIVKVLKIEPTQ